MTKVIKDRKRERRRGRFSPKNFSEKKNEAKIRKKKNTVQTI